MFSDLPLQTLDIINEEITISAIAVYYSWACQLLNTNFGEWHCQRIKWLQEND